MEALYAHYPGLIVLTPATVEDAYSMLLEAVAIDDPVIFCEHKFLYYHLKADALPKEALPIGKARIARDGRDLTIVTYSAMVHESLAAPRTRNDGSEIEVVDLRCIKPLDTDTVSPPSPAPGVCWRSAKRCRGVESPPKSSPAFPPRASACLTPRPPASTPRDTPLPLSPQSLERPSPHRAQSIAEEARKVLGS